MAIYKCKMCGGDLDVAENATVAVCDYCGSKQTVPTAQDEELSSLFNRANILRRKCEFDKAEQLYEKILVKDDKQSEAYWGVLLCRYGIEYVEDPATSKRIPTCHRTAFEAITSDEYYKSALQYADPVQKAIYKQEAKYIDSVQKEILALSQQEEPYDVFICYKETDNGKRTQDSVIANDIYYQLTSEGFKVFYAAITLENKLGSAYEPVIFAALNSAKVMLAIGTKPEYFNAVWVKNEWSRYLKMMKNDKSKQLIPCYRDMDAYELPEEFSHLQAQDMSKIGFISDIVRGIKKIVRKEEPKSEGRSSDGGGAAGLRNLMKRAYLDLESRNFDSARVQFDKMQDIDPENGEVYLIGLLCDFQATRLEDLEECVVDISTNSNFKKAIRFADTTLKSRLSQVQELNRKYRIYVSANSDLQKIYDKAAYARAESLFKSISGYRDSDALLAGMPAMRERYFALRANTIINELASWEGYQKKKVEIFEAINNLTNEESKTALTQKAEETACELKYQHAVALSKASDIKIIDSAEKFFTGLGGYKDSAAQAKKCREKIASLNAAAAALKKRNKITLIVVAFVIALGIFMGILFGAILPPIQDKADANLRAGLEYKLSGDGTYYSVSGVEDRDLTEAVILNTYKKKPVQKIEKDAFLYCNKLTSVTIPANVTSIYDSTFSTCYNLGKIIVDERNDAYCIRDGVLYNIEKTEIVAVPRALKGSVTIPNGVVYIPNSTFIGCIGLTSITIPTSVKSIGDSAFSGCRGLTTITIPESVTYIGVTAFANCKGLTSINIPNRVTSVGSGAFRDCSSLTSIRWNAEDCDIVGDAGGFIFSGCLNLSTIILGENVKNIPDDAFAGCDALTSINIPNSVISIGVGVFFDCDSLTSITIPSSVTSIGTIAFYGCDSLKSVYFDDPEGWEVVKYNNKYNNSVIRAESLSDPETAATYLVDTYDDYNWSKG